MLAQVILVTRLLGLVNGEQPFQVQPNPDVRSVEIRVDGKTVAKANHVILNFGPELTPHELTVIAYGENGNEIARDTQLINLGRPAAEVAITFDDDRRPVVHWEHLAARKPKRVTMTLDGKPFAAGEKLPPMNDSQLHVLKADVAFEDGVTASKELVFGGVYSEQMPAELTAMMTQSSGECLQLRGERVRAAAVEKPEAVVLFVQGANTRIAHDRLRLPGQSRVIWRVLHQPYMLEDAQMGHVWPVSRRVEKPGTPVVTDLFIKTDLMSGKVGTFSMLTGPGLNAKSQRFADAVAVAGVQALRGGKRRAVVLVLTGDKDESKLSAAVVRRYLQRIGVPLYVWSLVSATPKLTDEWGPITEVTSMERLREATAKLREELDRQRIAWLPIAPLEARHVQPCAAD